MNIAKETFSFERMLEAGKRRLSVDEKVSYPVPKGCYQLQFLCLTIGSVWSYLATNSVNLLTESR